MTTPTINTVKSAGSRFYVHPQSAEKFIGVTSVVAMLPKGFLTWWAAKVTAETAVEQLGAITNLCMTGEDGKAAAIDMLKRAHDRAKNSAASTGTDIHAIAEQLNRGEDCGLIHPDLAPSIDHYKQFLDDWQPKFLETEATVFHYDHKWAGTFDGLCEIGGENILFDLKTGKGVYEDVALQLNAYANAQKIVEVDGTERELPEIHGGAVLHLRPEGYKLIPVRLAPEIYEVFRSLIHISEWDREMKRGVLGAPQKLNE